MFDLLPETILKDGVEVEVSEFHKEIDAQYIHITSSPTMEGRLEAFRPDILGEFFVLLFLGRVRRDKRKRSVFIEMLAVSDAIGNSNKPLSALREFFQRLARNLCNYDQKAYRIETFWADLDAFLDPENFPDETDVRCAISIVRADMAEELDGHELYVR